MALYCRFLDLNLWLCWSTRINIILQQTNMVILFLFSFTSTAPLPSMFILAPGLLQSPTLLTVFALFLVIRIQEKIKVFSHQPFYKLHSLLSHRRSLSTSRPPKWPSLWRKNVNNGRGAKMRTMTLMDKLQKITKSQNNSKIGMWSPISSDWCCHLCKNLESPQQSFRISSTKMDARQLPLKGSSSSTNWWKERWITMSTGKLLESWPR